MRYVSPSEPKVPHLSTGVYSAYAVNTDHILPQDQQTRSYSPKRLDRWIHAWMLLDTLIQSPATSLHHLTSQHERYASRMVPNTPCPVPAGPGAISFSWAEFRADIEMSIARLPDLEQHIVELVRGDLRTPGVSLSEAAKILHKQKSKVLDAYRNALDTMARNLGWTPDPEDD